MQMLKAIGQVYDAAILGDGDFWCIELEFIDWLYATNQ
jgi:hypothetical protein